MVTRVEQVADAYGVSNGQAKKIIRRKAAKRGKHTYVAPKRGVPVARLRKRTRKS